MFCPYGSIKEIKYLGVNPRSIKERDVCANNDDNKVCSDLISKSFDDSLRKQVEGQTINDFSSSYLNTEIYNDYNNVV